MAVARPDVGDVLVVIRELPPAPSLLPIPIPQSHPCEMSCGYWAWGATCQNERPGIDRLLSKGTLLLLRFAMRPAEGANN